MTAFASAFVVALMLAGAVVAWSLPGASAKVSIELDVSGLTLEAKRLDGAIRSLETTIAASALTPPQTEVAQEAASPASPVVEAAIASEAPAEASPQ